MGLGINLIRDIIDNEGQLLDSDAIELNSHGSISRLQYYGIKKALPHKWIQLLRFTQSMDMEDTIIEILEAPKVTNLAYRRLNRSNENLRQIIVKWKNILGFHITYDEMDKHF